MDPTRLWAEVDITVEFFDVDSLQVVWHGNYLKYMERARCALLDHAELPGHVHLDVSDEGKRHFDVGHGPEFDLLFDCPQPGDMREVAVNGEPDQLAVQRLELRHHGGEGHEFGRADRGEVRRVAEEDDPFARVILREADRPLCGVRLKSGRVFAD